MKKEDERTEIRTEPSLVQEEVSKTAEPSEGWDALVESTLEAAAIGAEIRRMRLKRSMGLVDLGKRTGLSASFLSQLETGRVVPTLRNLSRIALTFGCGLEHFFRANENRLKVSKAKNRARLKINQPGGTIVSESMSMLIPDRSLVPCIAEFPAHKTDVTFTPEVTLGGEFVYIIEGSLTFKSSGGTATLEPGESMWTDASKARHYTCKAGQSARALIVTHDRGKLSI